MRKLSFAALFIILVVVPFAPATAQTAQPDVLFETQFAVLPVELNIADNPSSHVGITQDSGETVLRIKAVTEQTLSIPGGAGWDNYAIEMRIKVDSGQVVIHGRASSEGCGGYEFAARPEVRALALVLDNSDCSTRNLSAKTQAMISTGEWIILRLELDGDTILGYLNGTQVVWSNDMTALAGFRTFSILPDTSESAQVEIASIRVESLALSAYQGTPDQVISELQTLNLIPVSGRLLFQGNELTFSENSEVPLDIPSPTTNAVMSGEVIFTPNPGAANDFCGLALRVAGPRPDGAPVRLAVGLSGAGHVALLDLPRQGARIIRLSDAIYDLTIPHHVLVIANGDEASG